MEILVEIKNNITGEIKCYLDSGIWDKDNNCFSDYIWREGNFSCDCNRAIFSGDENEECGETRYSVNIKNPVDGKIIYQEY